MLRAAIASAVTVKSTASCLTTAAYPRYTPRANALASVKEPSCARATASSCVKLYVSSPSVDAGGNGVSASLGKSLMRVVSSSRGCSAEPSEARHASVHSASAAIGRDARVRLLFMRAPREPARSPRAWSYIFRAPASTPARATSEKRWMCVSESGFRRDRRSGQCTNAPRPAARARIDSSDSRVSPVRREKHVANAWRIRRARRVCRARGASRSEGSENKSAVRSLASFAEKNARRGFTFLQ